MERQNTIKKQSKITLIDSLRSSLMPEASPNAVAISKTRADGVDATPMLTIDIGKHH